MKKLVLLAVAVFLSTSVLLLGCASIMGKSGSETLSLRSMPDQADYEICDETGTKVSVGKTPANVPLEKKKGYFSGKKYTVKVVKANYTAKTATVDTTASGWYIGGNFIFGGLIGWLIVDPLTGAMWTFDSNEVNFTLEPAKTMNESINLGVVLLQDVPVALRYKMVKVQ